MNEIYWCGSVLNYQGLKRYKGQSPAASQWTKGLLKGFRKNNVEVKLFSNIWDSLFPKGTLFPGNQKYLDLDFDQQLVRYVNVPCFRTAAIAFSLRRSLESAIKSNKEPIAILNYNPSKAFCKALRALKKKHPHVTWINITLDLDDPDVDNWKSYIDLTQSADGHVFLSWWGYLNAPVKNKLHLDSGWCGDLPLIKKHRSKKTIFLYAGKLADYGGLRTIVKAIKEFHDPNSIFEFYGKGNHNELNELANMDKRVVVKGFVSDVELDKACKNADVFLSPCDINWTSTKMNFPSKTLLYLKYRKPIISQLLPGMSPEFEKVIITPLDDTSTAWKNKFESVCKLSGQDLTNIEKEISNFLMIRSWDRQAQRLISFVQKTKQRNDNF